jgi:hypothetical protein
MLIFDVARAETKLKLRKERKWIQRETEKHRNKNGI